MRDLLIQFEVAECTFKVVLLVTSVHLITYFSFWKV